MRTALVRFAAIFALVAGALVFSTAASADSSVTSGAYQVNQQGCNPGEPYTLCYTINELFNTVATPSGSFNLIGQGTDCDTLTVTDTGAPAETMCSSFKGHQLVQDSTTQEKSFTSTETIQYPGTTTCTLTERYQIANGQLIFVKMSVTGC